MILRLVSTSLIPLLISLSVVAQTGHGDSLKIANDASELKIFEKVDIEASFPGGEMAWRKFLEKNLHGDVATENGAPAGIYTVWIQFIVDRDGHVSDIKALTNNGFGMEQEVMRIIKNSAQWQPATQNGRMVKAYRKQPVTFMIEEDGYKITSKMPYVIYAGIDNPITITADKVRAEDLQVTMSQGSIIPKGDGNYIVRVNKTGRVVFHLFNKKNKEIGSASFEVRPKDESSSAPNIIKG